MRTYLSFETPVADIDARIDELRAVAEKGDSPGDRRGNRQARGEIREGAGRTLRQPDAVAEDPGRAGAGAAALRRLPQGPRSSEFTPLAGDRYFGEDEAIVGGLGRFEGESVCVIGQEKGDDTESRLRHNFGMARPEGYRKAARLMELADRFGLPVIALVDTAGAFPGVDAEERGQAEAIARSTDACLSLGVPNVAVIIGEGGSGGAIAIATANKVLMLEHAIYTVASPEAAASILWRDSSRAQDAATSMKITAQDLLKFGIIDGIVPEPIGGAHRDPAAAIAATGDAISEALKSLQQHERASNCATRGRRSFWRWGGRCRPSAVLAGQARPGRRMEARAPRAKGGSRCCRPGAGSGRTIRSASKTSRRPARPASSPRSIT